MSQQYSSSTHIYTDASKNTNGVGFAAITGNENHKFSLPPNTNIYPAKTYAIFEALKIASSSNSDTFVIISDSLSALKSISNPYSKNELVQNIQGLISTTNKICSFLWVPSHVGISGNETKDKFANKATLPHNALQLNLTTSAESRNTINLKILETWQKNWSNVPLSNKLRNIKPLIQKWNFPCSLKRRNEVIITRARIGHTHLTHSFLITKEPAPVCNTCKENLSIDHIVTRCPKYAEPRKIFKNSTSLRLALGENNTEV
ncbi:uncharacterized protein LOC132951601 [Metopolophium dirhodum]|uniref:uncharacterized protein LOC132951601 n=1 Tax=Metopolophium dirhodum TaxID=44670 RepID=UPI0029903574|nr:uncharacterized protein LOC132951601 [Metopolophium dirhodum]